MFLKVFHSIINPKRNYLIINQLRSGILRILPKSGAIFQIWFSHIATATSKHAHGICLAKSKSNNLIFGKKVPTK
jgi:hypothetical protein